MKVYQVRQRMVDCFEGHFNGWKDLGAYLKKERAEEAKAMGLEEAKEDICLSWVEIIEIEVIE